jgi:NADH-quinone oxidoreductase subunit N
MALDFTTNAAYLWAFLPEIVLSVWAMVVLLVDVFQKGNRVEPSRPVVHWLAIAGLVAAAFANGWLLTLTVGAGSSLVALDGFRVFANFIFLTAAAFALLISRGYLDRIRLNRGEFHVLVMFAVVGMMILAGARELMLLFLGLELMSVAIYVLVGFNRNDPRSAEASLKYFLLGAFASGFLLFGIALLFGAAGTTHFDGLSAAIATPSPMLLMGMGLLLVGFAFKVAAVPFHMWTPDAYDGAPTPVTALMATGVKAAAFAAFIRVFAVTFGGLYDQWAIVIFWLAAATMLGANLIALTQGSVKRMLAYSSVAHAGYLLVALASANAFGASAFLFYLVVYTLMTVGAFGIVIANARGDRDRVALDDYAGMGWEQPLLAAVFSVFLLSLAGFPLTGGFIGKLFILRAAVTADLVALAIILVMASLISYFYYLRVVVVMYMRPAPAPAAGDAAAPARPAGLPPAAVGAVVLASVLVIALFFVPGPLLDAAQRSVAGLFVSPEALFGVLP